MPFFKAEHSNLELKIIFGINLILGMDINWGNTLDSIV